MEHSDVILIALTPSCGTVFDLGKIQKLIFLVDKKVSPYAQWPRFNFISGINGPSDQKVYHILQELRQQGLVIIPMNGRPPVYYCLSVQGQKRGEALFNLQDDNIKGSLTQLSDFAIKYSFPEMENAIYKAYPETRKHILFPD